MVSECTLGRVAWPKATEMCVRGARHDAHQPFLGTKLSESYEPSNALFFLRKGKKAKDTLKRRSKCKYTLQLQLATQGSVTKRKPPGSDMQKYQTPHFPLSSGQNSPKKKSSGRNSVTFFICFFLNEKKRNGKNVKRAAIDGKRPAGREAGGRARSTGRI